MVTCSYPNREVGSVASTIGIAALLQRPGQGFHVGCIGSGGFSIHSISTHGGTTTDTKHRCVIVVGVSHAWTAHLVDETAEGALHESDIVFLSCLGIVVNQFQLIVGGGKTS